MHRVQHCPYSPKPRKYGTDVQSPLPVDNRGNSMMVKLSRFKKLLVASYYAPIICASGGYDCFDGLEHDCKWANKRNQKHNGKGVTSPWLFGDAPWCKNSILCIWHGPEYTFRCLVPHRAQWPQQSKRTFFHGILTWRWQTHQIKWSFPHIVFDFALCGGVSHWSWTWSVVPQLPIGDDF